ncbi:DUF4384 domain-containing protein [Acuticoccus mangrovi]|uniref:DUF4384 domain-containing protein n=1 Tax=Acuticoccus mangrovi TaxID=2796142 RepID=A0A934MH76_9HYPH|nr:DUF4384 domain-containing protein [Acuticoccus mangrovi]MBJ3777358.1 DUF4384 domain-containing protein [Acuticoccus mangrovi]
MGGTRAYVGAVVALVLALATPARAQDLEDAFATALGPMAERISGCLQVEGDKVREVLVIGVPRTTLRFTEVDRTFVNIAITGAVNSIALWRANQIETVDVLPTLLHGGEEARRELVETLQRRYEAPLVLTADAIRPSPDEVVVQLNLLGRDRHGEYGCSETAVLALDAATFRVRKRTYGADADYVLLGPGLKSALRSIAAAGLAVSPAIEVTSNVAETCQIAPELRHLVARLSAQLRADGAIGEAVGEGGSAPPSEVASIVVRPDRRAANALAVRVDAADGRAIAAFRALAEPVILEGCEPPPPKAAAADVAPVPAVERNEVYLVPDRDAYRVGDSFRVGIVSRRDCRLTILNASADGELCLLVPNPRTPHVVMTARTPYYFPPTGRATLTSAGEETFVALCDAGPLALGSVRHIKGPACAAGPSDAGRILGEDDAARVEAALAAADGTAAAVADDAEPDRATAVMRFAVAPRTD